MLPMRTRRPKEVTELPRVTLLAERRAEIHPQAWGSWVNTARYRHLRGKS